MKLSRVFALAVAGIMLVLALASCGAAPVEVTVKVTPDINDANSTIIDLPVTLTVANPTVLDALIEACTITEYEYTLDNAAQSVVDIDQYKDYTDADTNTTYYWYYTINGVEPTSGKASENAIANGDVVEYIYTSYIPD